MEINNSKEKRIRELEGQIKEQEKLASLGMLSAGIAHEIQNPLNFVINFSKISGQQLSDLSGIIDENSRHIPADDRQDIKDILTGLQENMKKSWSTAIVQPASSAVFYSIPEGRKVNSFSHGYNN